MEEIAGKIAKIYLEELVIPKVFKKQIIFLSKYIQKSFSCNEFKMFYSMNGNTV